jgi:hypothetical protein
LRYYLAGKTILRRNDRKIAETLRAIEILASFRLFFEFSARQYMGIAVAEEFKKSLENLAEISNRIYSAVT